MGTVGNPVDSFASQADSFSRMVGSVSRMADASSHTAGSLNRTADASNRMADSGNRMAGSPDHTADTPNRTAGLPDRMAGAFSRTAGGSNLTAEPASHANKSFIGEDNSSSRTVFRQKHAKTGKNRPFYPSRHARCAKSDTCCRANVFSLTRHLTPNSVGGEGETLAAALRKSATGLAGRSLAGPIPPQGFSLSRRTGKGQGGHSFFPISQPKTKYTTKHEIGLYRTK